MKSREVKATRAKTGVSRLWLGFAALAGAAIAYLGDRERGNARRQAAIRQLSHAAHSAADRTARWRTLVSSRLPGRAQVQLPDQVAIPTEPPSAPAASRSKRMEQPEATVTETKKPEL